MSSILIARASKSIGRATAAELARRGHRVVATGAHVVRAKGTQIATRKVPASDSLTGPTKAWAVVTGPPRESAVSSRSRLPSHPLPRHTNHQRSEQHGIH